MAIINFTGFETGEASGAGMEARTSGGTFAIQGTTKRTGGYALQVNPTTTATGFWDMGTRTTTGLHTTFSIANLFITFYFRWGTKPSADNEQILSLNASTTMNLRLDTSGVLLLYNATTLVDTGTIALTQDTWYRIEVNFDSIADTHEVKINGTVDLSGASAVGTFTSLVLGKIVDRNGETINVYYDDVCFSDSAYPGAGECKISLPIGAGSAAGWTNGTGTTFAEADEVPPDDDTTYIQAADTEDNQDHTFAMQTVSQAGIGGTIGAVKTLVKCNTATTAGTSTISHRILVDATGAELTGLEATTAYATRFRVDATNPIDASAWDTTSFDSLEVGMAANTLAAAATQRFTVAYAMVWSTGAAAAAITGTITPTVTEADIVAGGKTLIITLTGDTWIAAGAASFDLQRDEIIAGVDSAQSEALGWDLVPKATQSLGGVVRTSDTVVTITWDAFATYNITATETITVTVPSTATVGASGNIVATPTFTVTVVGATAVKDIIGAGVVPFAR